MLPMRWMAGGAALAWVLCSLAAGADSFSGELNIMLEEALVQQRDGRRRGNVARLRLDLSAREGQWEPVWGYAELFNRGDHRGHVREATVEQDRLRLTVQMRIEGDPWVPGGWAEYSIEVERKEDGALEGTYSGVFHGRHQRVELRGTAHGSLMPLRTAPAGFRAVEAGEHPRILFRRADVPALREKANTPMGRATMQRLREAADAAMRDDVPVGEARSAAVAMGVLYQIEGDPAWAERAIPLVNLMIGRGYHMGANNLPEPFGYNVARIAMTYDLCHDAWPQEMRERVVGHLMWMTERLMLRPNTVSSKMNWAAGSNYQPGTRGGAAVATLALWGERGPAPAEPARPVLEMAAIDPRRLEVPEGMPVNRLESGIMPRQWLMAGPFSGQSRNDLLVDAGGRDRLIPRPGLMVRHGEQTVTFAPLAEDVLDNTRYTGSRDVINLSKLVDRAQNTTTFLAMVWEVERAGVYEVHFGSGGVLMWLAGQPVREGAFVELAAGRYPVMVQVAMGAPGSNMRPSLVETTAEAARFELERRRFDYENQLADWRRQHAAWEASGGLDPQKARLVHLGQRHMARYYQYMMGDGGWQAEGEGYTLWSVPLALEYAHAHQVVFGQPPSPRPDVSMFAPRYVMQGVFPGEGRRVLTQSFGHSEGTMNGPHYARAFRVTHDPYKPAVLWAWNHVMGLSEPDDGPATPDDVGPLRANDPMDAIFSFLNYPLEMRAQNPAEVMPRAFAAPGRGGYIFRNGWEGRDDIVAQVFLKTMPPTGWNQPNAGSLRIHGLGHRWAINGNQPKDGNRMFENVVLLPEDPTRDNSGALPLHYEAREDGSGGISMDMRLVYSGRATRRDGDREVEISSHADNQWEPAGFTDLGITGVRAFAADYSGRSGAPALFVLADRIEGGRSKIWSWQLPTSTSRGNTQIAADVQVDGNTFVIRQGDATLRGTFVAPSDVNLRVVQGPTELRVVISSSQMTFGNRIFQLGALHASGGEDALAGDFLVVMTLQRDGAPVVRVDGEGLDARIRVGEQTVRFDGRRILIGE